MMNEEKTMSIYRLDLDNVSYPLAWSTQRHRIQVRAFIPYRVGHSEGLKRSSGLKRWPKPVEFEVKAFTVGNQSTAFRATIDEKI